MENRESHINVTGYSQPEIISHPWLQNTFSNVYLPWEPTIYRDDYMDIPYICHGLSLECRYNWHRCLFYIYMNILYSSHDGVKRRLLYWKWSSRVLPAACMVNTHYCRLVFEGSSCYSMISSAFISSMSYADIDLFW